MNDSLVLAVIPARGGSKGIPGKNLYPINGKPLIAYTIEAAAEARQLTRCIVSTDSEKIAKVARSLSGNVPFLRPGHLATDKALSVDVMKHAVTEMEKVDRCTYDYVVMLQPTTPLRTGEDIDAVVNKLKHAGCDSVVTMVDVGANHPARMYRIENEELVSVVDEGVTMRPRQELPPIYIRSGDVYGCRREVLFSCHSLMGKDCRAVIIPQERAVNIDCETDLVVAEHLIRKGNHQPG